MITPLLPENGRVSRDSAKSDKLARIEEVSAYLTYSTHYALTIKILEVLKTLFSLASYRPVARPGKEYLADMDLVDAYRMED